jgi:hypothetical protein
MPRPPINTRGAEQLTNRASAKVASAFSELPSRLFISSFPPSKRIENSSPLRRSLSVSPPGAFAVAKCIHGTMRAPLVCKLISRVSDREWQ